MVKPFFQRSLMLEATHSPHKGLGLISSHESQYIRSSSSCFAQPFVTAVERVTRAAYMVVVFPNEKYPRNALLHGGEHVSLARAFSDATHQFFSWHPSI